MQTFGPLIQGTAVNLYTSAPGAVSITLDNGIGAVANPSTTVVHPTVNTLYTASALSPTPPAITVTSQIQVLVGFPSPVQYLQAAGNCAGNVLVSWGGSQFTNTYRVDRSPTLGNSWTTLTNQSGLAYTDTTATLNSVYDYRVSPGDGLNTGTPEVIVGIVNTATPATPTVTAVPLNGRVQLSCPSVAGALTYNIYRSFVSGAETLYMTGQGPVFTDTNLTNSIPVYYKMTAVNNCGESSASSEVSATPLLSLQTFSENPPPATYWG